MKNAKQKTVLLCVAGMTPQIITETLWALTQDPHARRERIDEIRVITTLAGRDRIKKELLDRQHGQFYAFCRDYNLDPARIKFDESMITLLRSEDERTLEDIRTPDDNTQAANQIVGIVRKLTEDPHTRLHASVAGGRKTMSVYLAVAMHLFGRTQDRLSHVLVSEEFESHQDFYYIPPRPRTLSIKDRSGNIVRKVSTKDARIHLAEIPFIRLRGVLTEGFLDGGHPYSTLVAQAQENLDLLESGNDLQINLRKCVVRVAGRMTKLPRGEFFFYLLFAHLRRTGRGIDGMVSVEEINRSDMDAVFRLITEAQEVELGIEECTSVPGYGFLEKIADRFVNRHPNDISDLREIFQYRRSKINRKLESIGLPDRYLVGSTRERGAVRYGLKVSPERIKLA
jgi:CRISPR-associated protein (TIGR02584 family)